VPFLFIRWQTPCASFHFSLTMTHERESEILFMNVFFLKIGNSFTGRCFWMKIHREYIWSCLAYCIVKKKRKKKVSTASPGPGVNEMAFKSKVDWVPAVTSYIFHAPFPKNCREDNLLSRFLEFYLVEKGRGWIGFLSARPCTRLTWQWECVILVLRKGFWVE